MLVWIYHIKNLIAVFFFLSILSQNVQALPVYRSKIKVGLKTPKNLLPVIQQLRPKTLSYPIYYRIPLSDHLEVLPFTTVLEKKAPWITSKNKLSLKLRLMYASIFDKFKYYDDFSNSGYLQLFEREKKYNFVITTTDLIIVEIKPENKRFYWHSQHGFVSGFASKVYFAGELWKKGQRILINSNSKSYLTDKNATETVATFLAQTLELSVGIEDENKNKNKREITLPPI